MIRPPMSSVVIMALTTILATAPLQGQSRALNPGSPDGVLAAYLTGDEDAIPAFFKTSLDFQNRMRLNEPKQFDRWLGPFDSGKAVFVLALAKTAHEVGRQYVPVLLSAGGRYVDAARREGKPAAASSEFSRKWHRAAVALLQGLRNGPATDDHLAAIDVSGRADVASDARLILAHAIAQELRCWANRPIDLPSARVDALAKAAGVSVTPDLDGPTRIRNEAAADYQACLSEAAARFDRAREPGEVRAEASVRGGWVLVQQERFQDAIDRLDAAAPGQDRVLTYWRNLFRGRALSGLGRHAEAADAYREAFTLYPGAQSAGLGLAYEWLWLGRGAEADEIARSLRRTAATAVDPWTSYPEADRRFAGQLIESLRQEVIR
jgi:tetratricopeptide (TPR) repeat protein